MKMDGLYEFGPFRLNEAGRLLTRGDEVIPLQPKTFDLLLLLVQNHGVVVAREQLVNALWPDVFVEEANLSFQVSSLRKALGPDVGQYIQTVPKQGYRFAAKVVSDVNPDKPIMEAQASAGPEPTRSAEFEQARQWPIRGRYLVIAASTLAIITLSLIWSSISRQKKGVALSDMFIRPLTTYPGLELNPTLSPDGSQVAFSWNGPGGSNDDIYIKLVGPGEPIQLTNNPAQDLKPSWSPDGRMIAFLRFSSQVEAGLFLVPALGGAERKLADINVPMLKGLGLSSLSWTPDGKWIAFGGRPTMNDDPGIWLIPVEDGQAQRLTSAKSVLSDASPVFSPDGRSLVFIRIQAYSVSDVFVLRLTADLRPERDPERVTFLNQSIAGLAWTPQGRDLVFSSGASPGTTRLYRVRADARAHQGEVEPLPFGDQATSVTMARDGALVYARQFRDSNIRVMKPSRRSGASSTRLVSSTMADETPSFSPDGQKIAFSSSRSGSENIWIASADGSNPSQITFVRSAKAANPQWSPDGVTILFNSYQAGSSDLYLINSEDRIMRRLTEDFADEVEASWSRDGKWIYFGSNRSGRFELYKMPVAGGAPVRITRGGGIRGIESEDGKWVYFAKGGFSPTSIWKAPIAGGQEMFVLDHVASSMSFDVTADAIYFVAVDDGSRQAAIKTFNLVSGALTRMRRLEKTWGYGLAVSRDQRSLLYAEVDEAGSDLMLVVNFH
jgi:Tol biopolymer transport system component/DNA-binding winged helix-turn-helix (wHTH) protein